MCKSLHHAAVYGHLPCAERYVEAIRMDGVNILDCFTEEFEDDDEIILGNPLFLSVEYGRGVMERYFRELIKDPEEVQRLLAGPVKTPVDTFPSLWEWLMYPEKTDAGATGATGNDGNNNPQGGHQAGGKRGVRRGRNSSATGAKDFSHVKLDFTGEGTPPAVPLAYIEEYTNQFQHPLGEGGYGNVYQGLDVNCGKKFAVKKIPRNGGTSSEAVQLKSFTAELDTLRQFHHKNIIKLYGYADSNDAYYLILEFAHLGSLDRHLRDPELAEKLTCENRVSIAIGVAKALHFLHRGSNRRAFHRDVKSSNIVLTEDYTPKLIDCGLSHIMTGGGSSQDLKTSQSPLKVRACITLYYYYYYFYYYYYWVSSHVVFDSPYSCILTHLL